MIRYLREMSDLHLEFGPFEVPSLETDKETILLLCGDIHVKNGIFRNNWLENLASRFAHIAYLVGNHEHYGSSIDRTVVKIKAKVQELKLTNVTVLDNEVFMVSDKVKIIGGTCWTDFNKGNPITMQLAVQTMNDYRKIRHKNYERKFHPNVAFGEWIKFKQFLEEELAKPFDGTIIVATHHAPHSYSVDKIYANEFHGNGCYFSDFSETMLDHPNLKYWFHGHCHNTSDYEIGDCRIITNPRGYYPSDLNYRFNPEFLIEL